MWLFLPECFASVVQHRDDSMLLQVRFRRAAHAVWFVESCGPFAYPGMILEAKTSIPNADYPYRCNVHRAAFSKWLDNVSRREIDYDNFKKAAHESSRVGVLERDHYLDQLHEVWRVMRHPDEKEHGARYDFTQAPQVFHGYEHPHTPFKPVATASARTTAVLESWIPKSVAKAIKKTARALERLPEAGFAGVSETSKTKKKTKRAKRAKKGK